MQSKNHRVSVDITRVTVDHLNMNSIQNAYMLRLCMIE